MTLKSRIYKTAALYSLNKAPALILNQPNNKALSITKI